MKAIIALSGGVDSTVAAKITLEQGFDAVAVTIRFNGEASDGTCGSSRDIEDSKQICKALGIKHQVLDLREHFNSCVIQPFIESYLSGETPNPCVMCNKRAKLGVLIEKAIELGYDKVVTGHYVTVRQNEQSGRWELLKGASEDKDQSYVLYSLSQDQLARLYTPLGQWDKARVREYAESLGFINADKPDSQDICFVPDGDYSAYIEKRVGKKAQKGDFVLSDGTVLGRHNGIQCYTIGQRKGLGIAYGHPLYVVGKDVASNRVILGQNSELYKSEICASRLNWVAIESLAEPMRVTCRTRYHQKETAATIQMAGADTVKVVFDTPVRAATPGQSVVFYSGNSVIGGGIIV